MTALAQAMHLIMCFNDRAGNETTPEVTIHFDTIEEYCKFENLVRYELSQVGMTVSIERGDIKTLKLCGVPVRMVTSQISDFDSDGPLADIKDIMNVAGDLEYGNIGGIVTRACERLRKYLIVNRRPE